MSEKPARHEHERGAPLVSDCDTWCKSKYKSWQDIHLFTKEQAREMVVREIIEGLEFSIVSHEEGFEVGMTVKEVVGRLELLK